MNQDSSVNRTQIQPRSCSLFQARPLTATKDDKSFARTCQFAGGYHRNSGLTASPQNPLRSRPGVGIECPSASPRLSSASMTSLSDFLPKFGSCNSSSLLRASRSAIVLISPALRAFPALNGRSSTSTTSSSGPIVTDTIGLSPQRHIMQSLALHRPGTCMSGSLAALPVG